MNENAQQDKVQNGGRYVYRGMPGQVTHVDVVEGQYPRTVVQFMTDDYGFVRMSELAFLAFADREPPKPARGWLRRVWEKLA